jgi:hypothetical protein
MTTPNAGQQLPLDATDSPYGEVLGVAVQAYDSAGTLRAVGADNPLPVSGTFAYASVSGSGTDASNAAPSLLTLLATFTVTNAGQYRVQNQSASTIQVVYDNGTSGPSVQVLASGGAAGSQGADTSPELAWFTGRVRVYGAAGAQFFARHN